MRKTNRFSKYKTPIFSIFVGKNWSNSWLFLLMLFSNFIAAILEGVSFGCILLGFSALNGSLDWGQYPGLIYFQRLEQFSPQKIFLLFLFIAINSQALRSAATYFSLRWNSILFNRMQRTAQEEILRKILSFSFRFFHRYKLGDLTEYANAPTAYVGVMMENINMFVMSLLMIATTLCLMLYLSFSLTLFTLLLFSLYGISQKYFLKKISIASKSYSEKLADFTGSLVQSLQGIRVIHLFTKQKEILKNIRESLNNISHYHKRIHLFNSALVSISEVIGICLVGTILVVGMYLLPGDMQNILPVLLTFIVLAYRLAVRMHALFKTMGVIAGYTGHIGRLNQILLSEGKEFENWTGTPFKGLEKEISCVNLTFRYPGRKKAALHDLSFTIPIGSTIALVGDSGAGKSSFLDLFTRLYPPTSGKILIDGIDLQNLEITTWRKSIGVVSQDVFLFHSSVFENIAFGTTSCSEKEITEAAIAAGAHNFISKLPEGYKTIIGERGHRLSGGEKQRIALARALIHQPQILLLDEATSNLDSQSEKIIQATLQELSQQKTMIIVAHRLSTIIHADQILVIRDGIIIEKGKHKDLLDQKGFYAHLWNLQAKQEHEHTYN